MADNHSFCCSGCRQVYLLLQDNNLCSYYDLENTPGIKARGKFNDDRFDYLDDAEVLARLAEYSSENQVNITFNLPQIHCSSCIYLLENLHKIEPGIIFSQTNFSKKEIFICYEPALVSLKKVVQLLAFAGYEPVISLDTKKGLPKNKYNRKKIAELGIAGFCFSNIMMLSFPEYFSGGFISEPGLKQTFSLLILFLSLPVLFYCGRPFFLGAYKSLRHGIINIDAPIALAIVISFARSYYEMLTGNGAGYLDSATGIVFFMLCGRWFQDKTYNALSFDRQYKAYFPLGVTVVRNGKQENIPVTKLVLSDTIVIRNEEMVPADAKLLSGKARIDYSIVTGESEAIPMEPGALIFAGGKQKDGAIFLELVKEPSQSYITQLWNNDVFTREKLKEPSFIHPWSRHFTWVLLSIAFLSAVYWSYTDASRVFTVVTAVLIVACPCSLLLSATFTYGNMLRIFGKNKLYLKNATVVEALGAVTDIVLDKTGTLTDISKAEINFNGAVLNKKEENFIARAAQQSSHTLSKAISASIDITQDTDIGADQFTEVPGAGIHAAWGDHAVQLGSVAFVGNHEAGGPVLPSAAEVHVKINQAYKGFYRVSNPYRPGLRKMAAGLRNFHLHILSGDNDADKIKLQRLFGQATPMCFRATPQDKLAYIKGLQQHAKVLMLGDGLNDAGALKQADVGIAVSNDTARFSPACDAIMDSSVIHKLHGFIRYAGMGKKIVAASFLLSILYNIVGVSFAVQGKLSPMIAAILMPASSISIVLFVTIASTALSRKTGLR